MSTLPTFPCPLGDVVDRLAILAIKAERAPEGRRALVVAERDALRERWASYGLPAPESLAEWPELASVNLQLWLVEDRLRAYEAANDFGAAFVADARSVYQLNDARAALKRAVSERLGSVLIEVKLHDGCE